MSARAGYVRWHGGACVTTERSFDSLRPLNPREEKPIEGHVSGHNKKTGLVVVRRPACNSANGTETARLPASSTNGNPPGQPIQELAKRLQTMGAQQAARRLNEVTEERRRMGEQVHVRGHFGAQSRTNVIQPFTFSHAVKTPNGQMVAVVSTATTKNATSQSPVASKGLTSVPRKQRPARPVDSRSPPILLATTASGEEANSVPSVANEMDPPRPLRECRNPRASFVSPPRLHPDTSSQLLISELCPEPALTSSGSPRPPRSRSPAARLVPSPHLSTLPMARAHSPGVGSLTRSRQASHQSRRGTKHLDSTSRSRLSQSPTLRCSTAGGAPFIPARSNRMRQFAIETLASANTSSPRSVHESRQLESPCRRFVGARAVSVEHCSLGATHNKRRLIVDTANKTDLPTGAPNATYRPRVLSTGGTHCSSTQRSSVSSDEWDATAPSQGNSDSRSIGQRLIRVRL